MSTYGAAAAKIPEGERAVAVEEIGDAVRVGDDPGHVRRRRERPDPQRPVRVADELLLEARDIDVPVLVLGDHDDVGERLAPGQLVRVMLERPDEDHRALALGDVRRQAVAAVEIGGQPQVEDADQLVDRSRRCPTRRRSRTSRRRR